MLTAFCFLFDGRKNLRSGLSPLAILYVEKVNISREQKLIKYFKQRNSDVSGWSEPLPLLFLSVVYSRPPSTISSSAHLSVVLQLLHKDRKSVNPDRRDSPCALRPMALLYTYFCWPSRNMRLRRGLRRRLMAFSVEDGLRWRLMDFKVWQRISVQPSGARSYLGVQFNTRGQLTDPPWTQERFEQIALQESEFRMIINLNPSSCARKGKSGTSSVQHGTKLLPLTPEQEESWNSGWEDGAWWGWRCLLSPPALTRYTAEICNSRNQPWNLYVYCQHENRHRHHQQQQHHHHPIVSSRKDRNILV